MTPPVTLHAADAATGNVRLLRLLAGISSTFVARPSDQIHAAIEETQRLIVETLDLDRSTLWQISDDRAGLTLTHLWQRPGMPELPRHFDATTQLPWAAAMILAGKPIRFSHVDELPPEASRDVDNFRDYKPKSGMTIPLFANGEVFGGLGFGAITTARDWTPDEIDALELVARIIGNVIGRQRAEQRAEQLRIELARASRASTLGEIAAALAHEINQPLTAILGNAQAARRFIAAGGIDSAEILAILDDIIRDNKRAGSIILNLRRLLEGSSAAREICCLDELVAEACDFLEAGLSRENIRLNRKASSAHLRLRAARVEIQEVLVNLILNATQAMGETPPERRSILVETCVRGDEAVVQVTDHGSGFPPDQMDRLFEPFHSTKPNGLGMGLAICRRIIHAHGGSIEARNRECGGAVFGFSLPVHRG